MTKHPRLTFWLRLVAWILLAAVAPIVAIAVKYNIFVPTSGTRFSGWGFISVLILIATAMYVIKSVAYAIQSVMLKQVFKGLATITFPIVVALLLCNIIVANIVNFQFILVVMLITETAAIPINPMPKYMHDHHKDDVSTQITKGLLDFNAEQRKKSQEREILAKQRAVEEEKARRAAVE